MSDDNWRGGSDANPDDDFEDFGELRFSEEENVEEQAPLSFDDDNTGPLPHWTVKPTSELPRLFPEETTRDVSREVQRDDDGSFWLVLVFPETFGEPQVDRKHFVGEAVLMGDGVAHFFGFSTADNNCGSVHNR